MLNPKEQYQQAFRLFQAGEVLQAEHRLRTLHEDYPDHPDVLHLLGIVLKDAGQLEESVTLLREAVDKCPDNARFQYHYGLSLVQAGIPEQAIEVFNKAAAMDPDLHDARYNLAKVLKDLGDLDRSANIYQALLNKVPWHIDALYNLANIFYEQNRFQEARALYETAISQEPNHLNARMNLALLKNKQGKLLDAIDDLEKILDIDPDHSDAQLLFQKLNSQQIPPWHFDMLNDTGRNKAYDQAITRTAATARHVLEIGTGSGLLAMMAARAGAQKVTTCEMSAPLAKIAAKIIEKNGYADSIQVIAKKSTQLQIGVDMPEPADVLIAEVFDVGLLGEHFLPALLHAKRNLLRENAIIIPCAAKISAVLVECPELRRMNPIKEIAGFDLSDFNVFRPAGYLQVDINRENHRVLSDPFEVCHINFQKDIPIQSSQTLSVLPTMAGVCHAIVFWFDLYLDREIMISSRASTKTNHWKQCIQFFELEHSVGPGELITLKVQQSQTGIAFRL